MAATNARKSRTENGIPKATSTRIRPIRVLNRCRCCSTQMVGTTAGGMISPASTRQFDQPGHLAAAPLEHEAGHGAQDHHDRRPSDGQDDAVEERGDQLAVVGREHVIDVVDELPVRRQRKDRLAASTLSWPR